MLKDFVLFAVPRTGSSVVMTALHSHPEIFCHGEIFHPLIDEHIYGQARETLDLELREKDPVQFIHELLRFREGRKVVGFKIFQGHNDVALEYLLTNTSLKQIILHRSNLLASYSSFLLAKQTGVWNRRNSSAYNADKIRFVPGAFDAYCNTIEATYRTYRRIDDLEGTSRIVISYEEHVIHSNFTPILNFLGVDSNYPLSLSFQKLNVTRPIDRFSNPSEVMAYLEKIDRLDWLSEV